MNVISRFTGYQVSTGQRNNSTTERFLTDTINTIAVFILIHVFGRLGRIRVDTAECN